MSILCIPAFDSAFKIPTRIRSNLFPTEAVSVNDLVDFCMPSLSNNLGLDKKNATEYFSNQAPNIDDISTFVRIPAPPIQVLQALAHASPAMLQAGHRSICSVHLHSTTPHRFPLWIIEYWCEIANLGASREWWSHALTALEERRQIWTDERPEARRQVNYSIVEEVSDRLASLPWSGTIRGFSNPEPIHTIATYAMPRAWFSDVHEHQMLDLLRTDVLNSLRRKDIEVENLDFFKKI
ncbi:hypothetical protein EVG20_g10320, partial [Dentipellis fragilis]